MNFRRIKIGNTFLVLLILYFLGYTHLLGGPFWLAKLFFIVILIGAAIFFIFIYTILKFIRRKSIKKPNDEKLKVDAKIIE